MLYKRASKGKMQVWVGIHHESGTCLRTLVEGENKERENPALFVKCPKCGKMGYVCICYHDFTWFKRYRYIRVIVSHYAHNRTLKTCLFASLPLLDEATCTMEKR